MTCVVGESGLIRTCEGHKTLPQHFQPSLIQPSGLACISTNQRMGPESAQPGPPLFVWTQSAVILGWRDETIL
jgi:hypothetical protein